MEIKMSRELMQQALDYIKETYDFCVVMQQPKEREEQLMKSLEVALAQPKFDTPESHIVKWSIPVDPNNFGEALAQPEQEHIECGYDETVGMCTNNPCCEQAQPEQEFKYTPYGLRSDENGKLSIGEISQREWVGLTDEEIKKIVDLNTSDDGGFDIWCDGIAVAHIVCAKLKEKNA